MQKNPKIEICAFDGNTWLRVSAEAIEEPSLEAQEHMLEAYPSLKGMYQVNDGNTIIYALKNVTATFSSFTAAPRVIKF